MRNGKECESVCYGRGRSSETSRNSQWVEQEAMQSQKPVPAYFDPYASYLAATAAVVYFRSLRGEVNSLVDVATPDWAICTKAYAPNRSRIIYSRFVAKGA
jgi:hypothetical protein